MDELWYVLEGDFRFKAGDDMLQASTGGMAFGPRGMPHAFQNIGATPAGPEALIAVGHANWIDFIGPPIGISDPL